MIVRCRCGSVALRDVLRTEILRRAAATPSHPSQNRGGWRSAEDLFEWPLPEARELRALVAEAFTEVMPSVQTLKAWVVVNRNGSYHARHVHLNGDIRGVAVRSGVYYIDPGASPSAGTVFELESGNVRVEPEAGLLVIFPSGVWHSTEIQHGIEPRITVAFDAYSY